jgi:hypothetical protein
LLLHEKHVSVSTSIEEFALATQPWLNDSKSDLEYYAIQFRDGPKKAQMTIENTRISLDRMESVITELKK